MGWNHDPDAIHIHQVDEFTKAPARSPVDEEDLVLLELADGTKAHARAGDLPGGNHIVPFSWSGELQTAPGTHRLVFADNATLVAVVASCGVAPAGAAVIVDVNLNGTTIFTTQANRPTIADGGHQSAVETPDVTAVSAGDYLTVDIDQVGSDDPGEDLTVSIVWSN